jgi:hypothetical protein
MLVEEACAYRYEASICTLDVYGSQWTSTDTSLDGSRAGFEVTRELMSAHIVQCALVCEMAAD